MRSGISYYGVISKNTQAKISGVVVLIEIPGKNEKTDASVRQAGGDDTAHNKTWRRRKATGFRFSAVDPEERDVHVVRDTPGLQSAQRTTDRL